MTILNKFLIFNEEKRCYNCDFEICPRCKGTKKINISTSGTGFFSFIIVGGIIISGLAITDTRVKIIWFPIIFFIIFSIIGLLTLKEYKEQMVRKNG